MPAKRDVAERCAVIINSFSRIQPAILRAVRLLSLPFGAASRLVVKFGQAIGIVPIGCHFLAISRDGRTSRTKPLLLRNHLTLPTDGRTRQTPRSQFSAAVDCALVVQEAMERKEVRELAEGEMVQRAVLEAAR